MTQPPASPALRALAWNTTSADRRGTTATGLHWLRELTITRLSGAPWHGSTTDDEGALLVLAGTHDFEAGGKQWPQRGIRTDPFSGRPIALYLPRGTAFAVGGGTGEVLLVRAAPPAAPAEPLGKEEFSRKPLLVLAGSGKAFDPATGAWRPEEQFAESAEFLLPRHIVASEQDGVRVERIFAAGYKSKVLGLAEAVLADGSTAKGLADRAGEGLLYHRCEGELALRCGGESLVVRGEGVVAVGEASALELAATRGRAYVALALASPKSST